jgi:ligand-binding sensor domain-containing protein
LLALVIAVLAGASFLAAAQSEGGTIHGVVVDEVSAPVAGAKVTIGSDKFSSSSLTQVDGKFEFRKLEPGQYRITADAAGFRRDGVTVTVSRPGESLYQVIKLRASSLHVVVLDAASRQPLAGVVVTTIPREFGVNQPSTAAPRVLTDDGGNAHFLRLAPGPYQLTATLRGYDEYRGEVFISPGRVTTEFTLPLSVAPVIPINDKATTRFTVPNLPSRVVQAVFQDGDGWLWFGTDKGVGRYNGVDFRSSSSAASPYSMMAGVNVRSIAQDRAGSIWLATPGGVRRIGKDGTELPPLLTDSDVRHVVADSTGDVWASTNHGTFRFNGESLVKVGQNESSDASGTLVTQESSDGRVWIATAGGICTVEGNTAKPLGSLPAAKTGKAIDSSHLGEIRCLFTDRTGVVWVATSDVLHRLSGNATDTIPLSSILTGREGAQERVRCISQDVSGRLWIGLESGGAVLYDTARRESQRLSVLDHNQVSAIETDREGNTWFATDDGAVRADLYSFVDFNTSRGLPDNDVRVITETPDRQLWIATAAGISRVDGERLGPVPGFGSGISVRGVAFDHSGAAWLATDRGVLRSDGHSLTQLSEGNGLASNAVRWVGTIRDGTVLFATAKGASLFQNGSLQALDPLAGYDVRHVFENTDGRLWLSTARGVVILNPRSNDTELLDTSRGLADNDVRCVARFGNQIVVATHAGIQSYMPLSTLSEQRDQSVFITVDGEPSTALFADREGFLWSGAESGDVKKFAAIGSQIISTRYSTDANFQGGRRINSIFEDSDSRIWIATSGGAVRHLPLRVGAPTRIDLLVDGERVEPDGNAYELPYGRHRLTFKFTGVSMSGQVRYLYRLGSGKPDEAWTVLPMQQGAEREVALFDVPDGPHSFEVVTLNRDLYSGPEASSVTSTGYSTLAPTASVSFRIGLPFWKAGWFYALMAAMLALGVATVVMTRRFRDRDYILPKALRNYVPIEPNPFIVGNPIRGENMFFGREDDFRYVRTKLEAASQGIVIVFCGERRVGKSSILYQVMNGRLGDRFIPVFVDMQEMVISSDAEFFTRTSRLISESVSFAATRQVEAATAGASAHETSIGPGSDTAKWSPPVFVGNPYPLFLDFLDRVLRAIRDRTLLILIDEYELMESKVDDGKLSPELFTFLAGLMDNKERLSLVFTGSRRLEERDKKYWRELLRRSLFRKVGFLSRNDAIRLIVEPVGGKIVYGRGVVDRVCRLTAGQAFYTQVICQNTVDYLNEHRQNWVTLNDLDKVVAEILDNPLPQMIYSWDGMSDDEKLVLSLLAETLPDESSFAAASELRMAVRSNNYPVNLSENTIRLTLEETFRREIVDKDSADGFRFKMDLLRLWVKRAHSIWQVVNEVRTH